MSVSVLTRLPPPNRAVTSRLSIGLACTRRPRRSGNAPQISSIEWNYALSRETYIYAMALRADVENPFGPESDEVTIEEDDEKDAKKGKSDDEKKGKDDDSEDEERIRQLLESVANADPRPAYRAEDEAIREQARERLAELDED